MKKVSFNRVLKTLIDIVPAVLFCYNFTNLYKKYIEKNGIIMQKWFIYKQQIYNQCQAAISKKLSKC